MTTKIPLYTFIWLAAAILFDTTTIAQTPGQNKSVMLKATGQYNPLQINLSWQPVTGATSYNIYRKSKSSPTWGSPVATGVPGTATSWSDKNVVIGQSYEYRILKLGGNNAYGFILAGIEAPEVTNRGKVLLVYDTISTQTLEGEINRWIMDVEGDGWQVIQIPVNQNDDVKDVKNKIVSAYNENPQAIKSLFILGRVPIPYSGIIAPDGHIPDHLGAWPADGFYADMDGLWTDITANDAGASQVRNQNVPGDGKFDQNALPSDIELQTGRVDMRNLPAFNISETMLLKKYLDKNHAYRNRHFTANKKAVIDDNFPSFAEGFAAAGWRSFASLVGQENIKVVDYFTELKSSNFQWSYGCGPGSYTSCGGIGTTDNFVTDSLGSVFTMLFGSYFGDWDSPSNNFLRGALANGSTLTNCWAGRPYWHFHHMGLGETIGFSALISMNNNLTYEPNNSQRGIHMALMGDPTLRNDIVAPVSNLTAAYLEPHASLQWSPSQDSVLGYHIFRKTAEQEAFEQINNDLVTTHFYVDSCLSVKGKYTYMVRALKLENTNSGSYFNLSTGIFTTIENPNEPLLPAKADFSVTQNGFTVSLENLSINATSFEWSFGDGKGSDTRNTSHTYATSGKYTITLIATNYCYSDTFSLEVTITVSAVEDEYQKSVFIYPNPAQDEIYINIPDDISFPIYCKIVNNLGHIIYETKLDNKSTRIDLSKFPDGVYFFIPENRLKFVKFIINRI